MDSDDALDSYTAVSGGKLETAVLTTFGSVSRAGGHRPGRT